MHLHHILRLVWISCIIPLPLLLQAQTAKRDIRHGNLLMRDSLPAEADVWYRRALQREPNNPYASLNLGLALLMQQKKTEAHDLFKVATRTATTPKLKNKAYYNAGVALQNAEKLDEAIEAYKEALRLDPKDEEARYNLALCKRKKQQNDKKQNNNPKPKQGQGQGQAQNNPSGQGDSQEQQSQVAKKGQMDKEEADRLLNISRQQDREIQERLKKQGKPTSNSKAKPW